MSRKPPHQQTGKRGGAVHLCRIAFVQNFPHTQKRRHVNIDARAVNAIAAILCFRSGYQPVERGIDNGTGGAPLTLQVVKDLLHRCAVRGDVVELKPEIDFTQIRRKTRGDAEHPPPGVTQVPQIRRPETTAQRPLPRCGKDFDENKRRAHDAFHEPLHIPPGQDMQTVVSTPDPHFQRGFYQPRTRLRVRFAELVADADHSVQRLFLLLLRKIEMRIPPIEQREKRNQETVAIDPRFHNVAR